LSGRWCSKSLAQDEYIDKFATDSFFGVAFSGCWERNQMMVLLESERQLKSDLELVVADG
jgi:hypothetical protein